MSDLPVCEHPGCGLRIPVPGLCRKHAEQNRALHGKAPDTTITCSRCACLVEVTLLARHAQFHRDLRRER